jgi:hypothetical protein
LQCFILCRVFTLLQGFYTLYRVFTPSQCFNYLVVFFTLLKCLTTIAVLLNFRSARHVYSVSKNLPAKLQLVCRVKGTICSQNLPFVKWRQSAEVLEAISPLSNSFTSNLPLFQFNPLPNFVPRLLCFFRTFVSSCFIRISVQRPSHCREPDSLQL